MRVEFRIHLAAGLRVEFRIHHAAGFSFENFIVFLVDWQRDWKTFLFMNIGVDSKIFLALLRNYMYNNACYSLAVWISITVISEYGGRGMNIWHKWLLEKTKAWKVR